MRTYLQPHQIADDIWYSLSTWDYRVIAKSSRAPANARPYPNVVIKQGRHIKATGLAIWESSAAHSQDVYQGHASDGSSVQKHSCGGLYPYVIFAVDTVFGLSYGVVGPKKPNGILVGAYEEAVSFAAALKEAK